jgi:hypothetical protein
MTNNNTSEVVEAGYSWDGKLTHYKRVQSDSLQTIPIDPANADFARLSEQIENKTVQVVMPKPTFAVSTHTADGALTGYDTNLGFIPADPNNPLYRLLTDAINDRSCATSRPEPPVGDKGDFTAELVVCVFFDQPWPNVAGSLAGQLSVRPSSNVEPRPFTFVLRNLSDPGSKSALELLLSQHCCPMITPAASFPGTTTGILEIAIPTVDLRKIFRGEIVDDGSNAQSSLRDLLSMELVRTGRTAKEGPSIQWLINNAGTYVASFVSDFSNRIVEAFWNEFGGTPLGHVSPFSLQRQFLILQRSRAGRASLSYYSSAKNQNLILAGEWTHPVGLDSVSDVPQGYTNNFHRALGRLRMLIEGGFHMEAVVLVTAILEVSVSTALRQCVSMDSELEDRVRRLGHRRRLDLLRELLGGESSSRQTTELESYWRVADKLYGHRNSYVHELEFPDESRLLTHRQQRELETLLKHFADPWKQQFWFRWLDSISKGEGNAFNAVSTFCNTAKAEAT